MSRARPGGLPDMIRLTGARARDVWSWATLLTVAIAALSVMMVMPRYWTRTTRSEFIRQVYHTGARATPFVCMIGIFVGIGMVSSALLWTRMAGQTDMLGPFLAMVLVREVAPIMVNLIVLGRSGTAIAAEVATLKASGQVRVLEAQGMDPVVSIILPRAAAMAVSVACLCVIFTVVVVTAGYAFGRVTGFTMLSFDAVVDRILKSLGPADQLLLILKTVVPGFLTALICCLHGLGVGSSMTEVPRVLPVAFMHAMLTLFVLSAAVSMVL